MKSFFVSIFSKFGKYIFNEFKSFSEFEWRKNGVDADEGAEFDKKGLDLKIDPLEDSRLSIA